MALGDRDEFSKIAEFVSGQSNVGTDFVRTIMEQSSALVKELAEQHAKVAEAEKKVASLETKVAGLEAIIAGLEAASAKLREEIKAGEGAVKSLSGAHEQLLQKERELVKALGKELAACVAKAREEIEGVNAKHSEEIEEIQEHMTSLTKKWGDDVAKLHTEKERADKAEGVVKGLKLELQGAREALEAKDADTDVLDSLKRKLMDLASECTAKNKKARTSEAAGGGSGKAPVVAAEVNPPKASPGGGEKSSSSQRESAGVGKASPASAQRSRSSRH